MIYIAVAAIYIGMFQNIDVSRETKYYHCTDDLCYTTEIRKNNGT